MDAERVAEAVRVGQRPHRVEIAGVHGGQHDLADAGGARPLDDGGAVGLELGRVEVAMGVDPHPRDDA